MMLNIQDMEKWYWNAVRGLCIIAVIFIHVTVPIYADGGIRWEWYILRRITAFPVAVFFFMAGFFVHFDRINNTHYIWSKIKRVLIPYLLFSTVYIVLNILFGSNANWKGIMVNYLLGTSEIQMYYCIYLIQMILLLPLIKRLIVSKYRNFFMLIILFASMTVAYVKLYLELVDSVLNPVCLPFFIYYVIGLYVKGYMDGWYKASILDFVRKKYIWFAIGCVLVSLLVALVEGAIRYPELQTGQISIGNYSYCIAVISLLLSVFWKYGKVDCPKHLKCFVWLGEQSFFIYLCHMVIMRPMIIWFESINLAYPYRQIILFFGTLIMCIVLLKLKLHIERRCLNGEK